MTKFGDLSREQNNLISEQMSGVRVYRGVNKLLISHFSLLPISAFAILRHMHELGGTTKKKAVGSLILIAFYLFHRQV